MLYHPTSDKANKLEGSQLNPTGATGWSLELTGNASKTLDQSSKLTINGTQYATIKISNGAQCTLTAPEGVLITKLTIYDFINANEADATSPSYWKEVNGVSYDITADNDIEDTVELTGFKDNTFPPTALSFRNSKGWFTPIRRGTDRSPLL